MAIYEDMRQGKLTSMERIAALKAHEKVGGNGASIKPQPIMSGGGGYTATLSSSAFEEILPPKNDNTTGSVVKNTQSPIQLKIDATPKGVAESWKGKVWSEMSNAEKFQGGSAAAMKILDIIDMLTGGKDKVLPGSGHTYSPKQDYSMYIGQGSGYA